MAGVRGVPRAARLAGRSEPQVTELRRRADTSMSRSRAVRRVASSRAMTELSRRDALRGLLATAAAGVAACGTTDAQPDSGPEIDAAATDAAMPPADDAAPFDAGTDAGPDLRDAGPAPTGAFQHGVASGDPLPTSVILWTRVSEQTAPTSVTWEIASDTAFATIVTMGTFMTDADRDYTVKVDATGLTAGTNYYFRFRVGAAASPIGRTRTAPEGGVSQLRFALAACSSLAHGYFHAYRNIAARADLDAVLHVGDYIYEYGTADYGAFRDYEPSHECVSLADYRTRYGQYRRDADVQAVHKQHPFIVVWDDHETANNSYRDGAQNHTPATEGPWADRKAAALRAHREWMPIREATDGRIFRTLRYGDLVELVMLDTRLWGREAQTDSLDDPQTSSPTRQLLGADQETWFLDTLRGSTAQWKLVCQQVMMAQLPLLASTDQWDGYPAQRTRILDAIAADTIEDVVILTGDIHTSWAFEVTEDPEDTAAYDPATGRGARAVEFVTPGITSPGLTRAVENSVLPLLRRLRHFKWADLTKRGYVVLDVTPTSLQAAWYHMIDIERSSATGETFGAAWHVATGTSHLIEDTAAAAPPASPPPLAP